MVNRVNVEERQQVSANIQRKKRWPKKRNLFIGVLLFLFLASSISAGVGFLIYSTYNVRYHSDLMLAQTGLQHLQKAETLLVTWSHSPLDTQLTSQGEAEFTSAFKTFSLLDSDLQSLPQIIGQIPSYGAKLNTALRLVPLAITLSQMGVASCRGLNTLVAGLRNPLTPQARGLTSSDFASISQDVKELSFSLVSATRQIGQLQPSDMQFDARIPELVSTFHKDAPMIQQWLGAFEQLLPVAPTLLGVGTPANYLIEVLDSSELRPGGGFIGNYGTATFSGGRLTSARITDVDLLDRPFESAGKVIPYPASYTWFPLSPQSWSFRDSNLDADFPTAARYAEEIYKKEGGNVPVQGVIAITPVLIEQILAITGPIAVPEYHETITAQNLVARIHYHQLGGKAAGQGSDLIPSPDGHSSLRKRFTELLAEHLLAHVRQLPMADLSRLLLVTGNSLRSKDVQIYLNSSTTENVLHNFQLDAAIQSPVGDSLFVVDANIGANKANSFIITTMDDSVTIDSQGNAFHHFTLHYAWTIAGQNYGSPVYKDYVRIYVPQDSILLSQVGWQPHGTSDAFDRKVWMGYFTLSYEETRTITLEWKVPAAAGNAHYQYLIQRQAGILWKLNLQVALPQCAAMTNKWSGLISNDKQKAELTQWLTEDLNVGADYRCG